MQHDSISEEVTPLTNGTVVKPPTTLVTKQWRHPRVTIHRALKTTPVTLRTPSPFLPRFSPRTSAETPSAVKRKLFSVGSTPRKKPPAPEKRNLHPLQFRISGGKARTQPAEPSSTRKGARAQGGVLSGQLARCEAAAALNLRIFRSALATQNVVELNDILQKSLVLRILRSELDIFIVRSWSADSSAVARDDDFAVAAVKDMLPESAKGHLFCDLAMFVLFVPHPWSAINLSGSVPSPSGLFVIPHKLDLVELQAMTPILETCGLNKALTSWQRIGDVYGSQYEVPETQDRAVQSDALNVSIGNSLIPAFSSVSPHSTTVSVLVFVDEYLQDVGLAVVRDVVGERAVYHCEPKEHLESPGRQELRDVRISSQRIPVHTVLDIVSFYSSSIELLNELGRLHQSDALLVFTKHDPT